MFFVFSHAFEHHKANLIKHDLSRLKRLFSGQFEELKHKDVSNINYFKQFLRKNMIIMKDFLPFVQKIEKKDENYMYLQRKFI